RDLPEGPGLRGVRKGEGRSDSERDRAETGLLGRGGHERPRPPHGRVRFRLGEERRRLACLRVFLEATDDPAPRVVDRREVFRRQLGGPALVVERHLVATVLRRLDVPGYGRAVPLGNTAV